MAGTRGIGGRGRLFGSLCTLVFLVNLGRLIYAPLLEPFQGIFDASTAAVGLLATMAWIGSAAPRLPTGYLLTRYPRHAVVGWSGLVLAGSAAATAAAPSLPVLYAGSLLMGAASGVYFVGAQPLVSELFPDRVGHVIGIHGVASQVAAVIAPGFVALILGLAVWPIAGWRVIFLLIALAGAASTAAFYVLAARTDLPDAGDADRQLLVALRANWQLIATGVALAGLIGLVWNGLFNLYEIYLIDAKGVSRGVATAMLTLMFATGIPAFWVGGSLADRFPYVPFLLAITVGFVGSLYLVTVVGSIGGVVAASAIVGFVLHSLFPVTDTFVLDSLSDDHRGSGYALFSAAMMPFHAVGPFAVGWLVDLGFGFDAVFRGLGLVLLGLVAVLATLAVAGRLPAGGD